jgi:hypothetical protein
MAHIKRRQQLGIALEDIAGTAVAPTHNLPFLEFTLQGKHEPFADNQGRGVRYMEGQNSIEGRKSGEGKIDVCLDPITAPYWFAMAMGSIDSQPNDESGEGGYKHAITMTDDADPQTATIWNNRQVDEVEFKNCVVNSWELSFADEVAKLSLDLKSKFPTTTTRSIAEVPLKYYTFKNAALQIGEATIQVREFSLKGENNAELIYGPNSSDVDTIKVKGAKVSGSFKLLFEDTEMRDMFFNFTKDDLVLVFTGDDGSSISFNLPKIRLDNYSLDGGLDDLVSENIDFVAEYDTVGSPSKAISIDVVNDVPAYLGLES